MNNLTFTKSSRKTQTCSKILQYFKELEQIWGVLFILFSCLGIYVIKNVIEFQTNPEYNSLSVASLSDCKIIFPVAIITWIYRDLFAFCFTHRLEEYIDRTAYPTKQERRERSFILCKWILDFSYYSSASVVTYLIMKDASFFPVGLLGKGDISLLLNGKFPLVELPPYLKEMYCVQLGFHLYSFLYQIIMKRGDKKFMEYMLHHALTILLISYSYWTNFINLGSLTLLIHDSSDALLVFARSYAYLSFKNKTISTITYCSAVGFWIYTRLYCFPAYSIWCLFYTIFGIEGKYRDLFVVLILYYVSMVLVLLVMHIYWTFHMFKALFSFFTHKKIDNDYNLRKK